MKDLNHTCHNCGLLCQVNAGDDVIACTPGSKFSGHDATEQQLRAYASDTALIRTELRYVVLRLHSGSNFF